MLRRTYESCVLPVGVTLSVTVLCVFFLYFNPREAALYASQWLFAVGLFVGLAMELRPPLVAAAMALVILALTYNRVTFDAVDVEADQRGVIVVARETVSRAVILAVATGSTGGARPAAVTCCRARWLDAPDRSLPLPSR